MAQREDERELRRMRNADSLDRRLVAGETMRLTLADFRNRVCNRIQEELAATNPDNSTLDLWCEAIRLSREYEALASSPIEVE